MDDRLLQMLTLRKISKDLHRSEMTTDTSRYSGPEPQVLPLPPELIVKTLGYLDQVRDKKNARLVSKGFARAGLSTLTSTAWLSTSLMKLDRQWSDSPRFSCSILEIAMNPVVSKYITTLVCDSLLFPSILCQNVQDWLARLGQNRTSADVMDIHRYYVLKYSQERWIISNGEDRRMLLVALKQFVNLKSVLFTDVGADEPGRPLPRSTWPWAKFNGDL